MTIAANPPETHPFRSLAARRHGFAAAFAAILAISLYHRFLTTVEYLIHGFAPTYNRYRGFDPVADFLAKKGDVLWIGVAYDVLFSAALAVCLAALPRFAMTIAVLVLGAFYVANAEHVAANLSAIDLRYVGLGADSTFLSAHLTPDVLVQTMLLVLAGLMAALLARIRYIRDLFFGAAVLATLAAASLIPQSFRIGEPVFLQAHPLFPVLGQPDIPTDARTFSDAPFAPGVVPSAADARHNLLVIYLEGLSRHSLEKGEMSTLSALAADNIDLQRVIGHQIVTANGLHTSLTGVVPRFASSTFRWDAPADSGDRTSLPARLADAGYHTAFLQSAPLAYMSKDTHLTEMGYDDLRGLGDWDGRPIAARNGWGVDDHTLFRNVLDHIDQQTGERPWHMAVLTTGTHSPYNVPDDFLPDAPSDRYRALQYLDRSIDDLMRGLSERGLLEETVVIFTSDESRETSDRVGADNDVLLNWLPMIAIHPNGDRMASDAPIPAKALPQIWIDLASNRALDIEALSADPIIFGNSVLKRLYWYAPQTQDFLSCYIGRDLLCAHRADVADILHPSHGEWVQDAAFPGLAEAIARHE